MNITNARIVTGQGHATLLFDWDGVPAYIFEPRTTLLKLGAVYVHDGPPHEGVYPDSVELGIPEPRVMADLSNDPVLVEMGRRFAAQTGLKDGPVPVPTLAEALAARWDINVTTGCFTRLQ